MWEMPKYYEQVLYGYMANKVKKEPAVVVAGQDK